MFLGTVEREEGSEWLCGECTLWYYDNGNDLLYKGRYRAPSLSCVLLCSWEMQLEGLKEWIPRF